MNSHAHTRGMAILGSITALLIAATVSGQLAGNYSIDTSKPTGGKNFKSFEDATKTAFIQGTTAAVNFNIVPGTYNGGILVLPAGSSKAKPLTFHSVVPVKNQVKLTSPDHIVLVFPGLTTKFSVDGINFEGLDFVSTKNRGYAIWGNERNTNIKISKCTIHPGVRGHGSNSTTSSVRYLYIDGRNTATNWEKGIVG